MTAYLYQQVLSNQFLNFKLIILYWTIMINRCFDQSCQPFWRDTNIPVSTLLLLFPLCRTSSPLDERCMLRSKHSWSWDIITGKLRGLGSYEDSWNRQRTLLLLFPLWRTSPPLDERCMLRSKHSWSWDIITGKLRGLGSYEDSWNKQEHFYYCSLCVGRVHH